MMISVANLYNFSGTTVEGIRFSRGIFLTAQWKRTASRRRSLQGLWRPNYKITNWYPTEKKCTRKAWILSGRKWRSLVSLFLISAISYSFPVYNTNDNATCIYLFNFILDSQDHASASFVRVCVFLFNLGGCFLAVCFLLRFEEGNAIRLFVAHCRWKDRDSVLFRESTYD